MRINLSAWMFICISLILSPPATSASPPAVLITDESLTLEVKNTPLQSVLREVSRQGIVVRIDPTIDPLITAAFKNRPLNSAFSSILKQYSYSLLWDSMASSASEGVKLSEIHIFQQGQKEKMEILKTGQNLAVVRGKNNTFFVKNSLLVRLDATASESTLALLLDKTGATLLDVNSALGIVRLQLPEDVDIEGIAAAVSSLPGIAFAEPDYAYPLAVNRSLQVGPPPAEETNTDFPTRSGSVVAVLDSGLTESWSKSHFINGFYDAISPGSPISDSLGHGTQMSLIAAGAVHPMGRLVDPGEDSSIVSIRTFDENGFTSNSALLQGIDYAIAAGARVLSMSWGTETKSLLLESAVRYAAVNGLIMVAAAGNTPSGVPVYPAAYDNVIGVGALMPDGKVWQDSNHGDFVSLYAPGLANLPVGHDGAPGTYAGTSIATAYTANQIAEILAATPDADVSEILQTLVTDRTTGIRSQVAP